MSFVALKRLLPDRPVLMRILGSPFRGARIVMNPRDSLRKIFGFYEHELNDWLERALRRVSRVVGSLPMPTPCRGLKRWRNQGRNLFVQK